MKEIQEISTLYMVSNLYTLLWHYRPMYIESLLSMLSLMGITSYWWPLCSKTPSMHAKLAFRIPHFTHHSAADFRTAHSAFYFPHSAFYRDPSITGRWLTNKAGDTDVCQFLATLSHNSKRATMFLDHSILKRKPDDQGWPGRITVVW